MMRDLERVIGLHTILPAWSRNGIPLVFIILDQGLLTLLIHDADTRSQGADMSLSTTSTTRPPRLSFSFLDNLTPSSSSFQFSFSPSSWSITPRTLTLPRPSSETYSLTPRLTSSLRKSPWILLAPRGGCAGMTSIPTTRPPGDTRFTATCDHDPGA